MHVEAVDADKASRVFVVHGRNGKAARAMFSFLRAIGLRPTEWSQAVAATGDGSPYLGRILEAAFDQAQAIVVLMTPDDVVHLDPAYADGDDDPETRPAGQARPNVLFEAGMAMGRDEKRTILVELGNLRVPTDIVGRHVVRLDGSTERRQDLAQRLRTAGCAVDQSASHWMTEGDFTPPSASAGLPLGRRSASTTRSKASVDGSWHRSGGSRLDEIKITNTGTVTLLDLKVSPPVDPEGIQIEQDEPMKRLPTGKTATLRGYGPWHFMGGSRVTQFEVNVEAKLENGDDFQQDVFMDAG